MSFSTKANRIRNSLTRFKKESIVQVEIKRLSRKSGNSLLEAQKLVWLSCLLIEWLYQVDEDENAVDAEQADIEKILNSIYQLQDSALSFKDCINSNLALRKLFLGQMFYQLKPRQYHFFIIRMHCLLTEEGGTPYFKEYFKKHFEVELTDFFRFSLWLSLVSEKQAGIIKYEQIISDFYPKFSIEYVSQLLKLVSGGPAKVEALMKSSYTDDISSESYFGRPKIIDIPFFRFETSLGSMHTSITCKGLAESVLSIFKANDHEAFRKSFAKNFESYVGSILDDCGIKYEHESAILRLYKKHGLAGKVVDFLIQQERSAIFLDVKAIEPHEKIMVTDDPKIISQRLKNSFTKGIVQAFECAKILLDSNIVKLPDLNERFILIVTHQDFYLSSGSSLQENIDGKFFEDLYSRHGQIIPIENIHFCSIEDFEMIVSMVLSRATSISEFLTYCHSQDSDIRTKKFDINLHLSSFYKEKGLADLSLVQVNKLNKITDKMFGEITETIQECNTYWKCNGTQKTPLFIDCFRELCKKMAEK